MSGIISKRKTVIIQFLKFNFVGIINTGIDLGIFAVLNTLLGVNQTIAHIISFSCGGINSFFMNRRFTFGARGSTSIKQVLFFAGVTLLALLVSTLVLNAMTSLGLNAFVAKLIATACSFVVNFTGQKFLTFRH